MKNRQDALHFAWALADQAIVSLGNFGLSITLARVLSSAEYGRFSFMLSFFLLLNTLHQAFVSYALSVDGARAESTILGQLIGVALTLTVLINIPFAAVTGLGALSVHAPQLIVPAALALFAWQLQEVFRRAKMSQLSHHVAILTDTVRYLGVWGVVIIFATIMHIDGKFVLWVIVAGSVAGAVVGASGLPFPRRIKRADLVGIFRENWHTTRLVFWSSLISLFSVQLFLWATVWIHGSAAAGSFQALVNLVAIASPLMYGVENLLVPKIAKSWPDLSRTELRRTVISHIIASLAVTAPFFAVLVAVPDWVLRLFYGQHSQYVLFDSGLYWLVATYAFFIISTGLGAALKGCRANEGLLAMQLYSAVVGAISGVGFIWYYGVLGACIASALTGGVRVIVVSFYFFRLEVVGPVQPSGI